MNVKGESLSGKVLVSKFTIQLLIIQLVYPDQSWIKVWISWNWLKMEPSVQKIWYDNGSSSIIQCLTPFQFLYLGVYEPNLPEYFNSLL